MGNSENKSYNNQSFNDFMASELGRSEFIATIDLIENC